MGCLALGGSGSASWAIRVVFVGKKKGGKKYVGKKGGDGVWEVGSFAVVGVELLREAVELIWESNKSYKSSFNRCPEKHPSKTPISTEFAETLKLLKEFSSARLS